MTRLAEVSEQPRAFEVISSLLKTLVDANKDLVELQVKKQRMDKSDVDAGIKSQTNIEQAVFVGTAADLQKMITRDNVIDGEVTESTEEE